jgi:hypothetical protein
MLRFCQNDDGSGEVPKRVLGSGMAEEGKIAIDKNLKNLHIMMYA